MNALIIAMALFLTASTSQSRTQQQDVADELQRPSDRQSLSISLPSFFTWPLGPFPIVPVVASSQPSDNGASKWPMFCGNKKRHGRTNESAPHSAPQVSSNWTGDMVYSSPAGGHNGKIYIGSLDNKLYAYTKDLSLEWKYDTGHPIYSSPAVSDEDGSIYVRSGDKLFRISESGSLVWKYETQAGGAFGTTLSSPLVDDQRDLVFFQGNKRLYALDKNGVKQWECNLGVNSEASPAVDGYDDGRVYVAAGTQLFVIWIKDGSIYWQRELNQDTFSTPLVFDGSKPRVHVCTRDGIVYTYDIYGNLKWSHDIDEEIQSSPSRVNLDIYVGGGDKLYNLYDNDTSCTVQWVYNTGGDVDSSPAIDADGYVFVGADYDKVIAVKDKGSSYSLAWSVQLNDYVFSSPALLYGRVYVGCTSGEVVCMK